MPDDFVSENYQRKANKEDPDGFDNTEALTKRLLSVPKRDLQEPRRQHESNSPPKGTS